MSAAVEQVVFEDVWRGLYGESWKAMIRDEAFAHPAKFSRALIRKIYDHLSAEGWATGGDSVVDPFGGVALGALDAMRLGLSWYGVELEAKFHDLGNKNIELWNERYSRLPKWGTARLLQGDSRKLGEVLSAVECCVSSPPYANETVNDRNGIDLSLMKKPGGHNSQSRKMANYGEASGQLGAMKEGDLNLAISSPPYIDSVNAGDHGIGWSKADVKAKGNRQRGEHCKHGQRFRERLNYGSAKGQLGAMPEGQLCVTSPPYEGSVSNPLTDPTANIRKAAESGHTFESMGQPGGQMRYPFKYSSEVDNLGNQKGETFWSASRQIIEQLHQVIIPGGHAVFVVKAFVRDKQIVDFPGQWAQLCEAVGFRLLHHHRASLVEHSGTQGGFDEDKEIRVERKSFFRRLAESKGSPRIDHESVLCFERL
jgi:hypothetical protein